MLELFHDSVKRRLKIELETLFQRTKTIITKFATLIVLFANLPITLTVESKWYRLFHFPKDLKKKTEQYFC